MNRRSLLVWVVPCILVILAAMQLAKLFPPVQLTSLAGLRQSASVSNHWKSYSSTGTNNPTTMLNSQSQESQEKAKQNLGLPEPSAEGIKLDVSTGEGVRFDHLGPIVVNKDGSLSRITNWEKMAAIEKENTLRILAKRNKQRLDALKQAKADDVDDSSK